MANTPQYENHPFQPAPVTRKRGHDRNAAPACTQQTACGHAMPRANIRLTAPRSPRNTATGSREHW